MQTSMPASTPQTQPELTLFYDAHCPFCNHEMQRLKSWNHAGKLGFVDISKVDFDPTQLGVSMTDLDAALHGQTRDGRILVGLDTMLLAYTLIDKAWMVAPLKITWLRPSLSFLYRHFARHRYVLSRMMGFKKTVACSSNHCELKHPFFNTKQ
jgi:predicted DCC family thiol-disulfide oxidoreductase YuxK